LKLKEDEKFKLILGLGNKDTKSAIDTALLYAHAGVRFFDFAPEIFLDFKKALKKAGFKREEFTLCVSVAALGDIHGRKADISNVVCSGCGLCRGVCPEGAIKFDKKTKKSSVEFKKCIGCGNCKKTTNCYAISFEYANREVNALKELVLKSKGNADLPDMVEFHCFIPDKKQIIADFNDIISIYKGDISVCINRKQFSTEETVKLLGQMKNVYQTENHNGNFYVQADGASMNGGAANEDSTLDCILFAKELLEFSKNFGVKLILSGGTNINTPNMALQQFGMEDNCPIIAYGTYARKIVSNLPYNEALARAKELFNKTVNYDKYDKCSIGVS